MIRSSAYLADASDGERTQVVTGDSFVVEHRGHRVVNVVASVVDYDGTWSGTIADGIPGQLLIVRLNATLEHTDESYPSFSLQIGSTEHVSVVCNPTDLGTFSASGVFLFVWAGTEWVLLGKSINASSDVNTIAGRFSASFGSGNTIYGRDAVAIGESITFNSNGRHALAVGGGHFINSSGGVTAGISCTNDSGGFALGKGCTVRHKYALVLATAAKSRLPNSLTIGANQVGGSSPGMLQAEIVPLSAYTTNATPTVMMISEGAAYVPMDAQQVVAFYALISAYDKTHHAGAAWIVTGAIRRDNAGNTAMLFKTGDGAPTAGSDAGFAGAGVTVSADDANEGLSITVTGAASTNIYWGATLFMQCTAATAIA